MTGTSPDPRHRRQPHRRCATFALPLRRRPLGQRQRIENLGVVPLVIDKWSLGARVPAIIIPPFAKKAFIDHTQYETLSILSFIEKRFKLTPRNSRDQKADRLSNAFDFSQNP
ncbi:MAG TPA: alkaline phosphatase family protein [Gemmatimonadaceae bacterium]